VTVLALVSVHLVSVRLTPPAVRLANRLGIGLPSRPLSHASRFAPLRFADGILHLQGAANLVARSPVLIALRLSERSPAHPLRLRLALLEFLDCASPELSFLPFEDPRPLSTGCPTRLHPLPMP
jgi:hypothetical protein